MRATIHIVAKRDFWPYAVAIRAGQRDWWLRVRKPKPDEREPEVAADELRALMASGPRRHEELAKVVGQGWGMVARASAFDTSGLETRTLALRGRDETVEAWVAKA
jgi:hypothetical protein